MGQKINPVSLRLYSPNRHFDNCWYSDYFYKNLITRDVFLQDYLNNFLKLLKIPTGRYSIQHLQKKTVIYNFFCYSKSGREWRFRLFGLTKKKSLIQKNRFFLKKNTELKKKRKKTNLLHCFYTSLNQTALHQIQRKITSFQNFQLWSTLKKQLMTQREIPDFLIFSPNLNEKLKTPCSTKKRGFCSFFYTKKKQKKIFLNQLPCFLENSLPLPSTQFVEIEKSNTNLASNKPDFFKNQPEIENILTQLISTKPVTNLNRLFLHNLFVYKILKLHIKTRIHFLRTQTPFLSSRKNEIIEKLESKKTNYLKNLNGVDCDFTSYNLKYKNYLESSLSSAYKLPINIIPFKVKNDWQYASYLADEIVYFLEKRIAFRRLKSKIIKQLEKIPQIRGVRITCSGRVGGKSKKAQRAKTECIKHGQTPLQVFSSKIDFSVKTAFTSFGSVGVKVWICYN